MKKVMHKLHAASPLKIAVLVIFDAIACFRKTLELKPADHAASMYIDRCEVLKENPPEQGWDGVFRMTTK